VYLIEIDGVLLHARDDKGYFTSSDTIDWFNKLVSTVGSEQVIILTNRHMLQYRNTILDLTSNNINLGNVRIIFTSDKTDWIKDYQSLLDHTIIVVDDTYHQLRNIEDISSKITCYHANIAFELMPPN
jgi:hypothetical protein